MSFGSSISSSTDSVLLPRLSTGFSSCWPPSISELALRSAGKIFYSAPDVSPPQLIFHCRNFKSARNLNTTVTCGVGFRLLRSFLDRVQRKAIRLIDDLLLVFTLESLEQLLCHPFLSYYFVFLFLGTCLSSLFL